MCGVGGDDARDESVVDDGVSESSTVVVRLADSGRNGDVIHKNDLSAERRRSWRVTSQRVAAARGRLTRSTSTRSKSAHENLRGLEVQELEPRRRRFISRVIFFSLQKLERATLQCASRRSTPTTNTHRHRTHEHKISERPSQTVHPSLMRSPPSTASYLSSRCAPAGSRSPWPSTKRKGRAKYTPPP